MLSSLSLSLSIYHLCARVYLLLSCARAARCNSDLSIITPAAFCPRIIDSTRDKKATNLSRLFFFLLCAMAYIGSLSLSLTQRKNAFLSSCDHTFRHDVDKKTKKDRTEVKYERARLCGNDDERKSERSKRRIVASSSSFMSSFVFVHRVLFRDARVLDSASKFHRSRLE